MKNTILLILILLCITGSSLHAQINLRPGYIITNNNDTLRGVIDFRTDARNAHQCTFKDINTNTITNYSPGDIYGYRFTDDGKFYVTRKLMIEEAEQTLFLEYIVQGIISMYFYQGNKPYYFFEMEDGSMVEISQDTEKQMITTDGKTGYKKDLRYIGKLNYIFSKSKDTQKKVSRTHLGKFALADLTKKYHSEVCESGQECIEFVSRPDKKFITLSYTITAGVKYHFYKFDGSRFRFPLGEMKSASPSIGFDLGLTIPRWSQIIGANVSLDISKLLAKKDRLPQNNNYYKFKADAIVIDNRIGFRFNPIKTKIEPYIEAGYYQTYLAGLKALATTQHYESNSVKEYDIDYAENSPHFMPGYYGKIGFNLALNKRILSVSAYYQNASEKDYKIKTMGILAGFTF